MNFTDEIFEYQITEKLNEYKRINERIIYLADIYGEIFKTKKLKNKIKRSSRKFKILNQVFSNHCDIPNRRLFIQILKKRLDADKNEIVEIQKIILRKELGCSIYKMNN